MPLTVTTSAKDAYYPQFYGNLGGFWTRLFRDKAFVANKSRADSLELAQLYLNLMEAAACLGRKTVPAFHRERWFPVVIRQSEKNTGPGVKLFMGITPPAVLGPQPDDTAYYPAAEFAVGGDALKRGFVSYPMHAAGFSKGMVSLCSGIIAPGAIYLNGVDFYTARDSVVFRSELDPFLFPDKFPQRGVSGADGDTYEVVLWGSDVLVDRRYVYDHLGYLQSTYAGDPEDMYALAGGVMALRSSGTARLAFRLALGQIFATAVAGSEGEVVQDIIEKEDGARIVATASAVYTVRPEETLRGSVVKGAVLSAGEFLAETLKLYEQLNPDKFVARNGMTLEEFVADVPSVRFESTLVHPDLYSGPMTFHWKDTDITWHGRDTNGNPKLAFRVSSDDNVNSDYWTAVWNRAQARGVNLADMLEGYAVVPPAPYAGQVVGSLNPMEYAMRNCLSSSVSMLVVDLDAVPAYARSAGVMAELWRSLPAHSVLLALLRRTVLSDGYDCGDRVFDGLAPCSDLATCGFFGVGSKLPSETMAPMLECKLKIKEIPSCVRNTMPQV